MKTLADALPALPKAPTRTGTALAPAAKPRAASPAVLADARELLAAPPSRALQVALRLAARNAEGPIRYKTVRDEEAVLPAPAIVATDADRAEAQSRCAALSAILAAPPEPEQVVEWIVDLASRVERPPAEDALRRIAGPLARDLIEDHPAAAFTRATSREVARALVWWPSWAKLDKALTDLIAPLRAERALLAAVAASTPHKDGRTGPGAALAPAAPRSSPDAMTVAEVEERLAAYEAAPRSPLTRTSARVCFARLQTFRPDLVPRYAARLQALIEAPAGADDGPASPNSRATAAPSPRMQGAVAAQVAAFRQANPMVQAALAKREIHEGET